MPNSTRLPVRLALAPSLVMLALVAVLYAAAAWPLSRDLRQTAELRVRQDAELLAQRVQIALARRFTEMRQLGKTLERMPLADLPAVREELSWLKAHGTPAYAWVGLTDLDGRVIAASDGWLDGQSLKGRPVYEHGREALWFGEFHPAKLLRRFLAGSEDAEVWVADIGLPVLGPDGRPRAVLVTHLSATWLERLGDEVLGRSRRERLGLSWSLVQQDGKGLGGGAPPFLMPALPAASTPGWLQVNGDDEHAPHLLAYRPLAVGVSQELAWRVVVAQDLDTALAPLHRLYVALAGFALLTLVLGGALAWWASRRLARPYEALLSAAQQRFEAAGSGQTEGEFLRRLGDELVASLPLHGPEAEGLVRRLASDAQQLKRTLDHLPMGVLLCDTRQQVVFANATFCSLIGQPASSLQGQPALNLMLPADPQRRAELERMGDPPVARAANFELSTLQGEHRPVAWQRVPLLNREQRLDSVLMLVQDLSGEVNERRRADALQRRFALLINSALSDGFAMLGSDGRLIDWSQGAVHLTGWSPEAVQQRGLRSLFVEPEQADLLLEGVQRDGQARLTARLRKADGGDFFALGRLYQLSDSGDSLALIFSDVTAAQEATQRVQESEARLAAVIGGASDAIISTDAEGRVLLFNPAAERIFGVNQAEMLGQSLDRLLPPSERSRHPARMAAFASSESTRRPMGVGKVNGLRADGELLVLEAAISAARVGSRTVLTAILRDVSERDRAEQRMVEYQVQLTELTQRLLAQEKETTKRLAQVLHDELGQTLAAMRLMVDAGLRAPGAEAGLPSWVRRLDGVIGTANQQVRQVLTELRPPLLDDEGLHAALANEMQQQQARHEEVVLALDWPAGPAQRWDADVEYAAFMVAREALGNALRHARASRILLRGEGGDTWLRLSVVDDGVGSPELCTAKPGHLGMVGMRERALAIGARLEFAAADGGGLLVQLNWRGSDS